jgi:hypothetical protein
VLNNDRGHRPTRKVPVQWTRLIASSKINSTIILDSLEALTSKISEQWRQLRSSEYVVALRILQARHISPILQMAQNWSPLEATIQPECIRQASMASLPILTTVRSRTRASLQLFATLSINKSQICNC